LKRCAGNPPALFLSPTCGIIVNFYPKFATIERYFYDTDNLEILTSDGIPFQNRQMGTGELARAPNASCFQIIRRLDGELLEMRSMIQPYGKKLRYLI
jgi:hypothetical protein